MHRILVTGANGFVGQVLCKMLQESGHHVAAMVGTGSSLPKHANQIFHCDIRDTEALESAVAKAAPTHVVHLAAITHVPTSFKDPQLTWQTNVMGSINLLQALKHHAPKSFVLFVSSSEVYGATFKRGSALNECSPCQPLNPYAASKLAAEAAFNEYFRQGQPGLVVRPFNHIGAMQSPDFATASFARQIALIEAGQQAPVLKVGNLLAERDFLDVEDVCNAYIGLMQLTEQAEHYPRCLNICSGKPLKIRAILDRLLRLSSQTIEIVEDPERMRPSDISSAYGDNTLIRDTIGWIPQIDLQDTLLALLQYWRTSVNNAQ